MDFQLLIVRGRSASEALSLVDGVTTLGRHGDCHIRIKSSQVSRRHCEVFEVAGKLTVRDLGSSNGTLVTVVNPGNSQSANGMQLLKKPRESVLYEARSAVVGRREQVQAHLKFAVRSYGHGNV